MNGTRMKSHFEQIHDARMQWIVMKIKIIADGILHMHNDGIRRSVHRDMATIPDAYGRNVCGTIYWLKLYLITFHSTHKYNLITMKRMARSFEESEMRAKKKIVHGVAYYGDVDYLYCPMIVSDLRSCIDIDIRLYGNQKEIIRFFFRSFGY